MSHSSDGKVVLNFVGGSTNHEMLRSFYPERVQTVHTKVKGRRK
jgi:hypothetical protein